MNAISRTFFCVTLSARPRGGKAKLNLIDLDFDATATCMKDVNSLQFNPVSWWVGDILTVAEKKEHGVCIRHVPKAWFSCCSYSVEPRTDKFAGFIDTAKNKMEVLKTVESQAPAVISSGDTGRVGIPLRASWSSSWRGSPPTMRRLTSGRGYDGIYGHWSLIISVLWSLTVRHSVTQLGRMLRGGLNGLDGSEKGSQLVRNCTYLIAE